MLDKSIPYISVLMIKTDTRTYPRYALPEGYRFSGYQSGFEVKWAQLIFESGQTDTLQKAEDIFNREFLSERNLLQERCLFVLDDNGETVAVASLWHGGDFGEKFPRIHWVATAAKHQGKGIAKALMTKLMNLYNEFGYHGFIYLITQTWSYKAINIYSEFGFKPYKGKKPVGWKSDRFDDENEHAWQMIEKKIDEYRRSNQNKAKQTSPRLNGN